MCPLQGNRSYLPQNKQMRLFLKEEMGRPAHTPPGKWQLHISLQSACIHPSMCLARTEDEGTCQE